MIRTSVSPSFKLLALFVILAGTPLTALGWLGWRLLDQDRALESQRSLEQLENAAKLLTREVDRSLATWEESLVVSGTSKGTSVLPPNTVVFVFDTAGVRQHQGVPLPHYPLVSTLSTPLGLSAVFADAEAQEFREQNPAKAEDSYRRLASTADRYLRAAALMRLARSLRNQRKINEALVVYGDLAQMGDTVVAGFPSELLARRERIVLFGEISSEEAGRREAASLESALSAGRFTIDRTTFDFFRESTAILPPATQAVVLAHAVEGLWPHMQQQAAGRAAWTNDDGRGFVAVWRATAVGTAALVGDVDTLLASSMLVIGDLQVQVALEDSAGRLSWGTAPVERTGLTRTQRETGLPWTLKISPRNPAAALQASTARRGLWLAGFGLMFIVIAASGYLVFRSVNRELSVARLQSDFVSAVSHEFRTPLTAMRHLTEMLEEGDTPDDRLALYYGALGKETRRLQGMVESLLDFGRMESGRRTYRMEEMSASELATQAVDEFRQLASHAAPRIELQAATGSPGEHRRVQADREAIGLAIRNLLDNAIKYSPESSTVSVSVGSDGAFTGISVEDRGPGIASAEQRDVFRKFVRGSAARTLNVKGTGIGLAMADQIVKAHGGRLELSSEPGRGSRFTILLPTVRGATHQSAQAMA